MSSQKTAARNTRTEILNGTAAVVTLSRLGPRSMFVVYVMEHRLCVEEYDVLAMRGSHAKKAVQERVKTDLQPGNYTFRVRCSMR